MGAAGKASAPQTGFVEGDKNKGMGKDSQESKGGVKMPRGWLLLC